VIGDTFPPEKRGSALGLMGAVFGLAFILGPVIGGVLLLADWRWIFGINLPIALIVIGISWFILPQSRSSSSLPFDWAGMALLALGLAGLAIGLNQIDTTQFLASLGSVMVWPFLLGALIALPLFWQVEKRAADPIVRTSLLKPRQLRLANALTFGAGLGEVAVLFMPALAVAAFGVSSSRASFMLLPLVVALFIGSPLAGRLLDQLGSRQVVIAGVALVALGTLGMGIFGSAIWGFYTASVLIGLGLAALLGAPIRYITINEAAQEDRAAAQAVVTIFTSMGQLVGAALVGAVAASLGGSAGYTGAFLALAIIMFVLLVPAFMLKTRAAERANFATSSTPA
jgi:MFS family permease